MSEWKCLMLSHFYPYDISGPPQLSINARRFMAFQFGIPLNLPLQRKQRTSNGFILF